MVFGLMVVIVCHFGLGIIQLLVITKNIGTLLHYPLGGIINLVLLVVVAVVLVLVPPTYPTIKLIWHIQA